MSKDNENEDDWDGGDAYVDNEEQEEEDEEDEEDFEDDYDEDDDDEDDDDEDDVTDEGSEPVIPPFLNGDLHLDKTTGKLSYSHDIDIADVRRGRVGIKGEEAFYFGSKNPLPDSFSIESPTLDTKMRFFGWIDEPSDFTDYDVIFSKHPPTSDPLELKLLKAQEERASYTGDYEPNDNDDDNDNDKGGSSRTKKSPAKTNLKSPPTYSLKRNMNDDGDNEDHDQKTPAKRNRKSMPDDSTVAKETESSDKTPAQSLPPNLSNATDKDKSLYVVTGIQIGGDPERRITFRGLYYQPSGPTDTQYLISSISIVNSNAPTANGGTAAASAATSAAAAAAAPARKRTRSNRDDDDSVEGNAGVEYQELIDLHDDAGLSTEALRQRYYGRTANSGSGNGNGSGNNDDTKRKSTGLKKGTKESADIATKKKNDDNNDDDEDDDAYGF